MSETVIQHPFPFRKIAVAVAFSPRIEAILAESRRLQDIFKADMIFIHVGKKNIREEQYLRQLMHRFDLDKPGNHVLWLEGDPVEKILEACTQHQIDLLVAGALEKESLLKYFMGSVARMLCRRAVCSILMLREPDIHSKPIRNIVVEGSNHPKTRITIDTSIYIARQVAAERLQIIREDDKAKLALIRATGLPAPEAEEQREKIISEEEKQIEEVISCNDCGNLEIAIESIEGKPGFVISKFAREHHADLLMLNSPDTRLGLIDRVFPHDIEFALADLPCDLMIIHTSHKGHSES